MDQISRPLQVALLLTVALAALWLVALRPKDDTGSSTPSQPAARTTPRSAIPGGPGRALDRARQGAAQANRDAQTRPGRSDSAAGGSSSSSQTTPGSGSAAAPSTPAPGQSPTAGSAGNRPASDAPPPAIARALAAGRAVVLLFYDRAGADDRAVRSELGRVNRRSGRVLVQSAPISRVSSYGAITRGVEVLQSPTVIVVGPGGRARAFAGFTDHTEIDQAVAAALRA